MRTHAPARGDGTWLLLQRPIHYPYNYYWYYRYYYDIRTGDFSS